MTVPSASDSDYYVARNLRKTWDPFFNRFGRLTEVQRHAIPPILAGRNVLVCAATAAGKTEAACAPLVERYSRPGPWTLLYVSPTRALVNDLYQRLDKPMHQLGLSLYRRTGEYHPPAGVVPNVLLTTPESLDSMLCRGRKALVGSHALAHVDALVLDEIHLLFGSPRGEQLRWLQDRLARLRANAAERGLVDGPSRVQTVALSATVDDMTSVRDAHVSGGEIVHVPGHRPIEWVGDQTYPDVVSAVVRCVSETPHGMKILVFANARGRVDQLAETLRAQLDRFGYQVFAHHGSLSKQLRERAESTAKTNNKVVLVATSTLELGIDIGDIDLVVLDEPAHDVPSLLQRVGRGNRRSGKTHVLTCGETPASSLVHEAMLIAARAGELFVDPPGPNYAVARQQIASYIFQGSTRVRRRDQLERWLEATLPRAGVDILNSMVAAGELDEDGAGVRLGHEWLDMDDQGRIHSNIDAVGGYTVVDVLEGGSLAIKVRYDGEKRLGIGGKSFGVRRLDGRSIEATQATNGSTKEPTRYVSTRFYRGAGQARAVRSFLALQPDEWPVLDVGKHRCVFHFGGSRRRAVLQLIARLYDLKKIEWAADEWLLRLPLHADLTHRPSFIPHLAQASMELTINSEVDALEKYLGRPRANATLPMQWRIEEVKSWLALDAEIGAIVQSRWIDPTPQLADQLGRLLT